VGYGQSEKVMQGSINLPLGYDVNDPETEICVEVPWGIIIGAVWADIESNPLPGQVNFDVNATVSNPPKFQVTALHNVKYESGTPGEDGQDFFRFPYPLEDPGFYLAAQDWMPDTVRAANGEFNKYTPCAHNSFGVYGDQNVDGGDVGDFIAEFGRSGFNKPCPTCKP
jgi:hypothetical protein